MMQQTFILSGRPGRPKGHTVSMRHLRRKLTLRTHGEQIVLVKRTQERIEHVWMMAFLWTLCLPEHPTLQVEVDVGDKYKPDVVAMDRRRGRPQFWGEARAVGPDKIEHLVTHYSGVSLVFGSGTAPWIRSWGQWNAPCTRPSGRPRLTCFAFRPTVPNGSWTTGGRFPCRERIWPRRGWRTPRREGSP